MTALLILQLSASIPPLTQRVVTLAILQAISPYSAPSWPDIPLSPEYLAPLAMLWEQKIACILAEPPRQYDGTRGEGRAWWVVAMLKTPGGWPLNTIIAALLEVSSLLGPQPWTSTAQLFAAIQDPDPHGGTHTTVRPSAARLLLLSSGKGVMQKSYLSHHCAQPCP